MNVEMLTPEVQKVLTMQVLKRGMPARAYIDLLLTPNYLKDFNDRVVLETLLLNEQSRKDCTEDERAQIVGLLVMYWKIKGLGVSQFLPNIVKEAKWEADIAWQDSDDSFKEQYKDVDELVASFLQDKIEEYGIPDYYVTAKTNFEDLFEEVK